MAGNVAFFSAKSVSLSRTNGRKPCDLFTAARHNLREIQAELGSVARIDPGRTPSNVVLQGPDTARGVQEAADALLKAVDTSRLKRDHVQAIEAVFSVPVGYPEPPPFFAGCVRWAHEAMGLPVLSAVIHHDEDAVHAHVLLLPIRNGLHVGGAPITRPELRRLRDDFFAKVGAPAGFQRVQARLYGESKRVAIEAVRAVCEARGLPDLNGPVWPVMTDCFKANPLPWVHALGIDLDEAHRAMRSASPIGLGKLGSGTDAPIGLAVQQPAEPSPILCRPSRLSIGQQAIDRAIARMSKPRQEPVQDEGIVRVRDDLAHGTEHWD